MFKLGKSLITSIALLGFGPVQQAQASPLALGMTLEQIQAEHPKAWVSQRAALPTLVLNNTSLAGVSWISIRLGFDAGNRLTSLTLEASSAELRLVQALIARQLAAVPSDSEDALVEPSDDVEIRLCESSDTGLKLTFRRIGYTL